jgi:hypothetical protein
MLATLTAATFAPLVGEPFVVVVDEAHAFEARLSALTPWGEEHASPEQRTPFSLLFHAPREARVPQRIYRLVSDHLPPLELFMVPLGPDPVGMRYEVVIV